MATGLRELKKARTRQLIVDVMIELIAERGYRAITIEEICARSEITAPTFYNYFGSKEVVLGQIYIDTIRQFNAAIEDQRDNATSFETSLRAFTSMVAEAALANPRLWRALILWGDNSQSLESTMMEASTEFQTILTSFFRIGQESEGLRTDQSAELLSAIFDGAIYTLSIRWASGKIPDEQLEESYHRAIDVCLTGMKLPPNTQ